MIITPTPPEEFTISLDRDAADLPRSPGLHLSSIIRALALRTGNLHNCDDVLDPVSEWGGLPAKAILRIALGLAWEKWIARQLPSAFHMHELHHDGIFGSPDGVLTYIDVEPDPDVTADKSRSEIRIDEIKLTWFSANQDPGDQWMRLVQTKAYCYMIEKQLGIRCRTARWYIYHVVGDYGKSNPHYRGPMHHVWDLQFDEGELERNWGMIARHKELGVIE